jgi:hypothetical protein
MREEIIYFSKHQSGYETDRIHYSGTLINISKGGVGMKVNLPHHINEELWFEGIEGINRAQPGTVKWLRAENDQESFEMGIQFF